MNSVFLDLVEFLVGDFGRFGRFDVNWGGIEPVFERYVVECSYVHGKRVVLNLGLFGDGRLCLVFCGVSDRYDIGCGLKFSGAESGGDVSIVVYEFMVYCELWCLDCELLRGVVVEVLDEAFRCVFPDVGWLVRARERFVGLGFVVGVE